MQFICTHPDPRLCPDYFMVIFHGPTRQTVPPDAFEAVNWTNNFPIEGAVVTAKWTIQDPGHYLVYAYPDFVKCSQWRKDAFPWNTASVQGCPLEVNVKPRNPASSGDIDEGYGTCAAEQIHHGRYLAVDSALSPPDFSAMYIDTGRSYVYAPYQCKIPHRTVHEAIALIPLAKHFLYLGDSTTRSHFCTEIWEGLHGTVENGSCRYANKDPYLRTNKYTHALVGGDEPRNVNFSFLWSPIFETKVRETIMELNPPPTHVVFNTGLYVPLSYSLNVS